MKLAALIIGSYLLGSIPFGLLIAAAHGKDLRKIGSGNIGATNLSRALGRKWAYLCFALDAAKGLVPMVIALRIMPPLVGAKELSSALAVGCAAILGHIFPIYIKFKGGKGVATSFGVALGLWPYYTLCAAAATLVWLVTVAIWRYISLGSIAAAAAFPVTLAVAIAVEPAWHLRNLWPLLVIGCGIPVMVVARHKENIKRLLAGTESRILQRK